MNTRFRALLVGLVHRLLREIHVGPLGSGDDAAPMEARTLSARRTASDLPVRVKDRFLTVALEWSCGCLWCGAAVVEEPLPGSGGRVSLPLCAKHVRWAMAARREGMGKQNRILKGYLAAWCRVHGGDREAAMAWLEAGRRVGGR